MIADECELNMCGQFIPTPGTEGLKHCFKYLGAFFVSPAQYDLIQHAETVEEFDQLCQAIKVVDLDSDELAGDDELRKLLRWTAARFYDPERCEGK